MLTVLQALILGLIQGLTELFPISSLGHSVILPSIFGWHINQDDSYFLSFLVATHVATALVLVGFFWQDWVRIAGGAVRLVQARRVPHGDTYAKLALLVIAGTIPAGLIGLALQKPLGHLFASASTAAFFLIINGCILLGAERLRARPRRQIVRRQSDHRIAQLHWRAALGIGLAQAAALIPGISRSGSSMAGGLLAGLSNEDAARFSFLLATPIIGGAALLKVPSLFHGSNLHHLGITLVGAVCAGAAAYVSVRFLVRYFQEGTLRVYGQYCIVAGIVFSFILLFQ